jgi:trans-aconitate 2-methyltransferase
MLRLPPTLRSSLSAAPRIIPTPTKTTTISRTMASKASAEKDWSATQYLKFNDQRTRPVHDLIAQIKPLVTSPTPRIYDLGCGPGNSTSALLSAFPGARITGMDSSADMLRKARSEKGLESVEFVLGDLAKFEVSGEGTADLLFSNAVFHWLRSDTRIPTLLRLFEGLGKGGVLAIQVPDNYAEHSHKAMRDTALVQGQPWSKSFEGKHVGELGQSGRPDLDPIEPAHTFYNALNPLSSHIDIWRTTYSHVLEDPKAIVEWVKGTGLQPFINEIEDDAAKKAYLEEYEKRVGEGYQRMWDGKVILGYPRLFVLAVRK